MRFWVTQEGRLFKITVQRRGEMWQGLVFEDERRCFECWSPDFEEARQSCLTNAFEYVRAGVYPDWDGGIKPVQTGEATEKTPADIWRDGQLIAEDIERLRPRCVACNQGFAIFNAIVTIQTETGEQALHGACFDRLRAAELIPPVYPESKIGPRRGIIAAFTDSPAE